MAVTRSPRERRARPRAPSGIFLQAAGIGYLALFDVVPGTVWMPLAAAVAGLAALSGGRRLLAAVSD
jgi:hypothetical protein